MIACAHTVALAERALSDAFADSASATAAQTFLLDTIGVAFAGHAGTFAAELRALVPSFGQGDDAAVLGTTQRLPAASAAMVNAYLIHNQEFDCVHEAAVVHPMAVIVAVLLAEADRLGNVSGAQFQSALIAAVEVAATLGMASRSPLRFFRPAQCGALGAVAGLARLHQLSVSGLCNAWGLLLGQLSGTMQAHREGVPALPMQIAYNARNVLVAFDLQQAGLVGPQQALTGEFGYFALFEGAWDFAAALAVRGQLGRDAICQLSHKPYPSGRATHAGVAALIAVLQTTPAGAIEGVTLHAPPLICQLVDRRALPSMRSNYAKLCFPYCAASVLATGNLDIEDFSAAALTAQSRLQLSARVQVLPDGNSDPNALIPQRLVVRLSDGTTRVRHIDAAPGAPDCPLSNHAHQAKFERNAKRLGATAAEVEQIRRTVAQLPTLTRFNSDRFVLHACSS